MKRSLPALLCILILGAALIPPLSAEATSLPNLYRYHLANGLELLVYRDTAVPLARVQVVFRAGAISQSPDTAGLFHLYEHLVFGGSASHPGSAAMKAAMAGLGVSEWNGGTQAERVSYWFTLPASKTDDGIRFWAETLKAPAFDPAALETEKEAVVQEIRGLTTDPDSIFDAAITKRLFGKYPWRRDPGGSEQAVRAATVDSLRAIQRIWFVPNNAALIVGGDVDPDAVRAEAEHWFGDWQAGPDPWKQALPPHPRPGVRRPTWLVYPDPSLPEGLAYVEARYRGPDLAADAAGSYGGDLWSALVANPDGRFKTELMKNVPKLYGKDAISAFYVSQREGAWVSLSTYFITDPELPAVDRVRLFKERARGFEITSMKTDPTYFSAKDYDDARKRLLDSRAMAQDDSDGMVDALAFWWASASIDYFLGYPDAIAKAGPKEVGAFLDTYIMRNLEVVALRMNPADYEKEKRNFQGSGFDVVGESNAFWWQK